MKQTSILLTCALISIMSYSQKDTAKKRSQWELSGNIGYSLLTGDVSGVPFPAPSISFGLSGRFPINNLLSVRPGFTHATSYGMDYRLKQPNMLHPNTVPNVYADNYTNTDKKFVASYKTTFNIGTLDLIFSLHNGSKTNIYTYGGYAAISGDVNVNALNRKSEAYDYSDINFKTSRKEIWKQLRELHDNTYESNGPVQNGNRNPAGLYQNNALIRHGASLGGGAAIKISGRFNLGIDYRMTKTFSDDFDGIQSGIELDIHHLLTTRINYNIGNKKKTEPMWWMKMMNITNIHNTNIQQIIDLDTDGDGVMDSLDHEKITLQKCFPVDSNGVGSCPEVPCCTTYVPSPIGCNIYYNVMFNKQSVKLSRFAKKQLMELANSLKQNPECKIAIKGIEKQGLRIRVEVIYNFLIQEGGISLERIHKSFDNLSGEIDSVLIETIQEKLK
jgi:hypothetical protein